jgi:hypothetical protein
MSIVGKRWWMVCAIAFVIGVFAYSYFINIQRDENRSAEIVGE